MDDNTNPQGSPVDPAQPAADVPPVSTPAPTPDTGEPAPEIQPEPNTAPESSPAPEPQPGGTVGTETVEQNQGTDDNTGGNPV